MGREDGEKWAYEPRKKNQAGVVAVDCGNKVETAAIEAATSTAEIEERAERLDLPIESEPAATSVVSSQQQDEEEVKREEDAGQSPPSQSQRPPPPTDERNQQPQDADAENNKDQ